MRALLPCTLAALLVASAGCRGGGGGGVGGSGFSGLWGPRLPEAPPGALEAQVRERAAKGGPAAEALERFYAGRGWRPVWFEGGRERKQLAGFLAELCRAEADGLDVAPAGALHAQLRALQQRPEDWPRVEVALSEGLLRHALERLQGRVAPRRHGWRGPPREADLAAVLQEATQGDPREALARLLPSDPGYARLREALAQHRALEARGGWPVVPTGPALELGARDPRVAVLRQRLAATGELEAKDAGPGPDAELFDARVQEAVKAFQARHGLEQDGTVGGATLRALRVSTAARARQLQANLERWRWLPAPAAGRSVWVNVPAAELEAREGTRTVQRMRVVVGRPDWPTPTMADAARALVLHPEWRVPPRIAKEELLPRLKEDPEAVAKMGLQVTQAGSPVEHDEVDWDAEDARTELRLMQAAGPGNPLGKVKFVLGNRLSIYLHDTPARAAFTATDRALSHGCIRVEQPDVLALFLLRDAEGWDRAKLDAAFAEVKTVDLPLPAPVPVQLTYFTAFVDEDGRVQFRRDVYARDAELVQALGLREPVSEADAQARAAACGGGASVVAGR